MRAAWSLGRLLVPKQELAMRGRRVVWELDGGGGSDEGVRVRGGFLSGKTLQTLSVYLRLNSISLNVFKE